VASTSSPGSCRGVRHPGADGAGAGAHLHGLDRALCLAGGAGGDHKRPPVDDRGAGGDEIVSLDRFGGHPGQSLEGRDGGAAEENGVPGTHRQYAVHLGRPICERPPRRRRAGQALADGGGLLAQLSQKGRTVGLMAYRNSLLLCPPLRVRCPVPGRHRSSGVREIQSVVIVASPLDREERGGHIPFAGAGFDFEASSPAPAFYGVVLSLTA
jgi:hypothetical protein